ncbi:hypothetical protein [Sporomusa aerivorans]|uniref:hypothetical protein n=1 Tax=Sporomusa aerivorans TaxID=204936 RepID=UPI00352A87AA
MKPDLAAIQKAAKKLGNIKNRYVPGCGHEVVTKLGTLAFVDKETNRAQYLDRDTAEVIFAVPALLDYIAELERERQWVAVSERLPEPPDIVGYRWQTVNVICETPAGNRFVTSAAYVIYKDGKTRWQKINGFDELGYKVIAWQLLPPLPEVK